LMLYYLVTRILGLKLYWVNISEEHTATIFEVQQRKGTRKCKQTRREEPMWGAVLQNEDGLFYFTEDRAAGFTEILTFWKTKWWHVPGDIDLHTPP
jgi:hypothetical protein